MYLVPGATWTCLQEMDRVERGALLKRLEKQLKAEHAAMKAKPSGGKRRRR